MVLAAMAEYHADVAALDADDAVGRARLLRSFRLRHGAKRVFDRTLGFQVEGGLDPVGPESGA